VDFDFFGQARIRILDHSDDSVFLFEQCKLDLQQVVLVGLVFTWIFVDVFLLRMPHRVVGFNYYETSRVV